MKVIFFGLNSIYSIVPLLALNEQFEVQAVFVRENDNTLTKIKKELKRLIHYRSAGSYSIEKCCKVYGIPYYVAGSVNDASAISLINSLQPDVICMAGFDEKLGRQVLAIPKYGILNAHTSLLPDYKGSNPFFWMIKNNEIKTGCTVHLVNEEFDAGSIVEKESIRIYEGSGLFIYNATAANVAARLLCKAVQGISKGGLQYEPNSSTGLNCRNPGENELVITSSFKVKQALWFFNAFSDAYEIKVEYKNSLQKCISLSRVKFRNSREMQLSDGLIYIETE